MDTEYDQIEKSDELPILQAEGFNSAVLALAFSALALAAITGLLSELDELDTGGRIWFAFVAVGLVGVVGFFIARTVFRSVEIPHDPSHPLTWNRASVRSRTRDAQNAVKALGFFAGIAFMLFLMITLLYRSAPANPRAQITRAKSTAPCNTFRAFNAR